MPKTDLIILLYFQTKINKKILICRRMTNRRALESRTMQKCFVSLRPNCSAAAWTCSKAHFYIVRDSRTLCISILQISEKRFGNGDRRIRNFRACLKKHSSNLHITIYGIFCLHSVDIVRYTVRIQTKHPTNCDAHLAESIFQTRSSILFFREIDTLIRVSIFNISFPEKPYSSEKSPNPST